MYTQTFVQISNNIKVEVQPVYLEEESNPAGRKHVFGYYITIHNLGELPVQLLKRHWIIRDSTGEQYEVDGEGVVGQQPDIYPEDSHEYNSYCVIESFEGSMKGYYLMERYDGELLKVTIPEFLLRSHLLN